MLKQNNLEDRGFQQGMLKAQYTYSVLNPDMMKL